jgi:hypothetical protein
LRDSSRPSARNFLVAAKLRDELKKAESAAGEPDADR